MSNGHRPSLRREGSKQSLASSVEDTESDQDGQPQASTSSLPLEESVATLQPPTSSTGSRKKKRRTSKGESSNASVAGSSEGNSPTGSFLSRFISSFRSDPRPGLSRSISSPQHVGTPSNGSNSQPPSPTLPYPGPPVPPTFADRFRPPFGRRGASDTSGSSRSVSPSHSPHAERSNPHDTPASRRADRSADMVKRGSVTSQRTVQPRKASHTISPLASPTLPSPLSHSYTPDPLHHATPNQQDSNTQDHLRHAMSILSDLVPPALLLLAYIGPNHLFAPSLSAAISEAIAATSPTSPGAAGQSLSMTSADNASIASSAASISSLPTMLTSTSVPPSHTHELHSPASLPLPAVTASSLWKVLQGFEWLTKANDGTNNNTDSASADPGDFDFPSLVQASADFLAAEAASRKIEVLIGQAGSGGSSSPVTRTMPANAALQGADKTQVETKELLVTGDERQWMVTLTILLRQVLQSAGYGSTIEVNFSAKQTSHGVLGGQKPPVVGDSQDTYVPTRASLRKQWTVSLDVSVFDNASSPGHATSPVIPRSQGSPFESAPIKSLLDEAGIHVSPRAVDDAVQPWHFEASLPGALLAANESPSELLGKRRASLETANREPTMDDLKRFADSSLKGLRVSLHASEYSVFAKHLATFLATWGLEVTYIPVDRDDDVVSNAGSQTGGDTYWNKGRREPVSRFDSGFASAGVEGGSYEPPNSPLRSSSISSEHGTGVEGAPNGVAIVDDDVATLRRLLYSLKPPVIHAAPLLAKRPQLATRRTRSSPHVRQLHHASQPTPGWPIIHFTSLSQFKAVKEVIAETIAISKSGNIPEVIVVPKPAGPRRCITALWTALKRPTIDPSLPPIATAPFGPGGQYCSPRLSPALSAQGQDFDTAVAEPDARSEQSSKPRTPPAAPQPAFPTAPYPPSPLSKVSDEQTSYFTDIAESMDGVSPSEGMVVQSPDGRPAIFFQPSKRSHRSSHKDKAKGRGKGSESSSRDSSTPKRGDKDGPESPPASQHIVSAPHEIGLGQPRRMSGSAASSPGDGPNVPLATPALSLDAFINFAKGPRREGDGEPESAITASSSRQDSSLSRHTSSSSSAHPASNHSSRPGSERASKAASPRPSILHHSKRSVSGANSPPGSPRLGDSNPITTTGTSGANSSSKGTSTNITPGPGNRRKSRRKNSLMPTVPPINVLIVEDNPINQTILSMFMKKKGIKYAVAKDGEEAVQKWKDGDFHLVLMDIQLPVKDGITATREIRDLERQKNVGTFVTSPNSDAPTPETTSASTSPSPMSPITPLLSMPVIIVALTASSLNEDRVTALAAGCNDFLTKPVSLPWLQQKLLEWGSMAYLSGFSKRMRSSSINSARPTPTAGFKATAAAQAQNISNHLHIDPQRSHGSKQLPTNSVESPRPPGASGPSVVIQEATPEVTPANAQATNKARDLETEARHEAMVAKLEKGPDLDAVDAKLSSLKHQADTSKQTSAGISRPPPVPLVPKQDDTSSSRSSLDRSQPSLESVLSEGSRLTKAGQARHSDSSFGQVMTDSFAEPEAESEET